MNPTAPAPLEGKVVLVTGSTRHLGYGIARSLLRDGAKVYINSPSPENVARALEELHGEGLSLATDGTADVSDAAAVAALFEKINREDGRIDLLVNNACHLGVGDDFLENSVEFWDTVMGVNARGYFLCSQQAARMMKVGGGGTIVHMSSNTSLRAIRGRSAYIASKGAINALTRAMAVDLAPHGIRVTAIALGYVHTTRWDELSDDDTARRRLNIPLGQEIEAGDVVGLVRLLAGEGGRLLTGDVITLDGGVCAQLLPKDCEV